MIKLRALSICFIILFVIFFGGRDFLLKNSSSENKSIGLINEYKKVAATAIRGDATFASTEGYGNFLDKFTGLILTGRPTDDSITVNLIAVKGMDAFFEYGTSPGNYSFKTTIFTSKGDPIETIFGNLKQDTRYYFRAVYRKHGNSSFTIGDEGSFNTQRPVGSSFVFDVQAAPHRRHGVANDTVYKNTLFKESADNPDFVIDLGDTFMAETFAKSYEQVRMRYLEERSFFGIIGSPLFLVMGNHDGEVGWLLDDTENNIPVWATKARKEFYLNPVPDDFYTGNSKLDDFVGLRENYYAWEWGDALFIVLDPFWYTTNYSWGTADNPDKWTRTIGSEQYFWLKNTLESSKSKYKFVFQHDTLVDYCGISYLKEMYEWGGKNEAGLWEFDKMRPGWPLPLLQLMLKNNVTIIFVGQHHVFDKEVLNSTVFIEVPQPSWPYDNVANALEYGCKGDVLGSSGYLRISVSPQNVSVEYVRTSPRQGVAYSFVI